MALTPNTELFVERLKTAGLRVTPQRLAIYGALIESGDHPTAQTLFETLQPALPSLSQATVYNTLQAFVVHGLVQEIGAAGDGAIHYDADLTPHVNLICTTCHRVEDVGDARLHAAARQAIAQSSYQIQGMRIACYGVCPRCQAAAGAPV